MIDMMKKAMLAGIGATVFTKEAVESAVDDLVTRGQLSVDQGRKVVDEVIEQGRKEFDDVRQTGENGIDQLMQNANLVTQRQFRALEARVVQMEAAMAKVEFEQRQETTDPTGAVGPDGSAADSTSK